MSVANKKEPEPIKNDNVETWEEVIKDYLQREDWYPSDKKESIQNELISLMRERNEFGRSKYNTALQPNNGRNNIADALQEALDAVVYLKNELLEKPDEEIKIIYEMAMTVLETIYIKWRRTNEGL